LSDASSGPVYLDYQATTPVDSRVAEAMDPYFKENFGNAASDHLFGQKARAAVETARNQVAALVGSTPQEVIFTSGATESNNLALKGLVENAHQAQLISCAIEHKSVLDCLATLERSGHEVTLVSVDADGVVDIEQLAAAIKPNTAVISVMFANNEIGTIQPIEEIGRVAQAHGVVFHCDAAQAVGKLPVDVDALGIDLLSISAHKFYGPKGIGALFVRRTIEGKMRALIDGGGHERGLRSGTLNVPGCVGLGEAARLAVAELEEEADRSTRLRDRLWLGIQKRLPNVRLNGHPLRRLPGNLNISFVDIDADAIMANMPDVAVSSGSACSSAVPSPSHVLKAIGLEDGLAEASIRFGVGRFTTDEEIDYAVGRVCDAVTRLNAIAVERV
jgi:cysteine desulfurase